MPRRSASLLVAGTAVVALLVGLAGAPAAQARPDITAGNPVFTGETTKSVLPAQVKGLASRFGSTTSITYHNGPVMNDAGGVNVYYIWYGSWASNKQSILTDFANNVGGSPYFNINTTYASSTGAVKNIVTFKGGVDVAGTKTTLSDSDIQAIVAGAISSNAVPSDPKAVYFVLTAAGIGESSGFLTKYCGWHTHAAIGGSDIKYSFVGDPTGPSLGNCSAQTTSPNGDAGADAMVSVIAHELEEAATDPDLNAWYDRQGYENADKCAWKFGTTSTINGAKYNMTLGSRKFLIQQNWNAGSSQACRLSYP